MELKMYLLVLLSYLFVFGNVIAVGKVKTGKVSCFYDRQAYNRGDQARVLASALRPAISLCNYIVYSFFELHGSLYQIESPDEFFGNIEQKNFESILLSWPSSKVLASVGGFWDQYKPKRHLKLLEKEKYRSSFIASAVKLVNDYKLGGIDLAWKFPVKQNKNKRNLGSIWYSFNTALSPFFKDNNTKNHKEQFANFVCKLGAALRQHKKILTLSILPHVDGQAYFDVNKLKNCVKHIHLMTYDYKTPQQTPKEADLAAPLEHLSSRNESLNVEATVNWWLGQNMTAEKLFISIPTFSRTWKLTTDAKSGDPPVKAHGVGAEGPYLNEKGRWAYYELCRYPKVSTEPYAFRLAGQNVNQGGQNDNQSDQNDSQSSQDENQNDPNNGQNDESDDLGGQDVVQSDQNNGQGDETDDQTNQSDDQGDQDDNQGDQDDNQGDQDDNQGDQDDEQGGQGLEGIWVSNEGLSTAAKKAQYAKKMGLGGIAIIDLSTDDFSGSCSRAKNKFPITREAKKNLVK